MEKKLSTLFKSTLLLSAFTFGGGYVIISLMKTKFVDEYQWINQDEMYDFISLAQSCPGAVAINASIAIGYSLFGFIGVLIGLLATILPPFIIISVLSLFYNLFINNIYISLLLEGMLIGVGVIILIVAYEMILKLVQDKNYFINGMLIGCFILLFFYSINIIYLILIAISIGIIKSLDKRIKK